MSRQQGRAVRVTPVPDRETVVTMRHLVTHISVWNKSQVIDRQFQHCI